MMNVWNEQSIETVPNDQLIGWRHRDGNEQGYLYFAITIVVVNNNQKTVIRITEVEEEEEERYIQSNIHEQLALYKHLLDNYTI
jgi:transketolase N-terminal domain/subunit